MDRSPFSEVSNAMREAGLTPLNASIARTLGKAEGHSIVELTKQRFRALV